MNTQLLAIACSFLGILSSRLVLLKHTEKVLKHRTVIVGTGEKAQHLERLRRRTDSFGVQILGYVDINEHKDCYVAEDNIIKLKESLSEFVSANNVEEIVIAVDDRRSNIPHDELLACKMMGVNMIDITSYLERQLGKIPLDTFRPSAFVYSDGFSQAARLRYKRLADILISSAMLIVFAPLMLVTALGARRQRSAREESQVGNRRVP